MEYHLDWKQMDWKKLTPELSLAYSYIDWDSAECLIYSIDYYQRLTLESWFANLEQTPLNRCPQLPAPYKRLINDTKHTNNKLNWLTMDWSKQKTDRNASINF